MACASPGPRSSGDRAPVSGTEVPGFESCRGRHHRSGADPAPADARDGGVCGRLPSPPTAARGRGARARGTWRWTALACLSVTGACDGDATPADAGPPFVVDPTGTCPSGMALIPGGEFTMGSDDTTGVGADGSSAPAHRVRVHSFCLDETPATAAAYDSAKHEAPLVVGHPATDDPAYGLSLIHISEPTRPY